MKKLRLTVTFIIIIFFSFPLSAQPLIDWAKNFGTTASDVALSVLQASDGGYVVMGQTMSNGGAFAPSNGLGDFGLLKLDATGTRLWAKNFGGDGFDNGMYISATADGGYILCGSTHSNNGDFPLNKGSWDFGVVKTDAFGNKQWSKTYGGTGTDNAFCVKQTADGGYILGGLSNSSNGDFSQNNGGLYDYAVIKIDASGTLQWAKNYGGSDDDQGYSIEIAADGGYAICGWSKSNNGDFSQNNGDYDYGVIKINSAGVKEWAKNFGGSQTDKGSCIQQTADGGFITNGQVFSNNGDFTQNHGNFDYGVIKMTSTGIIQWSKCYGGSDIDAGFFVATTSDGGYILSGSSYSSNGDFTQNNFISDYGIIKIDANGNKIWSKNYGGTSVDSGTGIRPTSDGGFIMCGNSHSVNGDFTQHNGQGDYGVIKLSGVDCSSLNINITATPTASTCATSRDGKISLSSNVSTIKKYQWSSSFPTGNGNGSLITGLDPDTYTVTVTLNNGCTMIVTNVIVGQGTSSVTATPTAPTCLNGTNGKIVLTATPAVTYYLWSNGVSTGTANNATINNLAAGTYGVTVTLSNNCPAFTNNIILLPGVSHTITATPSPPICNNGANGSINLASSGTMSSFAWSNGITSNTGSGANINNLQSGNYTITVTHNNGCKTITTTNIPITAPTSVSATPTIPLCLGKNDGLINLSSGTPIATFNWSNGSTTGTGSGTSINNLLSGTYNLTVTHTNGCRTLTSVTIATGPPIVLSAIPTIPTCLGKNDASIALSSAEPITSFIWSNGTTTTNDIGNTINNLSPGTYNITATLSNGCKTSTSATISVGTPPNLSATPTRPSCLGKNDGSIGLSSSEPIASFVWSNGSTTTNGTGSSINPLGTGSYSITATHANGCTSTTTAQIQPGIPAEVTGAPTPPTCTGKNDGSISLSSPASSVATHLWTGVSSGSGNGAIMNNLTPGVYTITATLSDGCTATTTVTVPPGVKPNLSATPTPAVCLGVDNASIALSSVDAIATFSWASGAANGNGIGSNITNLKSGTYNITATLANGCVTSTIITIPPSLPSTASGIPSTPSCLGKNDGSISLSAAEPIVSYNWVSGFMTGNGNGATISNLKSGTYNITVTLSNGCLATTSVTILPSLPLNLNATPNVPSCFGNNDGSITLSAVEAIASFNWTNNSTTGTGSGNVISNLKSATYDITATLTNGCIAIAKNVVMAEGNQIPLNAIPNTPSCLGGKDANIALSASSNVTNYFWSNGNASANGFSNSINNLQSGVYTITATLANGCVAIATNIIITEGSPLNLNATPIAPTCLGRTDGMINLSSIASVANFTWISGSKTNTGTQGTIKNLPTGNYTITATLTNGCIATIANVNVPNGVPINLPTSVNAPLCLGKNNGSISLNITPVATNFTWTNGSTSNTGSTNTNIINGLAAGTYNVTATLSDKCIAIRSNIIVPAGMVFGLLATPTDPTCAGKDGQLALSVAGQTIQSYQWQSGSNTGVNSTNPNSITNLSSGTYNISATLTNGCLSVGTATLKTPASATISLSAKSPTCENGADGSITLNPLSSTIATYTWSDGVTTKTGNSILIDSLPSGNYSITVSFTNSCEAVATTKINTGTVFSPIAVAEESSCSGGDGKINLSGNGFTVLAYQWSSAGATQSGNGNQIAQLNQGNYLITATLSNGCQGIVSAIVPLSNDFSVSASTSAPSCEGKANGAILLNSIHTISTYTWVSNSLSGNSLIGLQSGTYTITVTSKAGCETLLNNVLIPVGAIFSVSATPTPPSCEGKSDGKILLNANLTINSYQWANNSLSGNNLTNLQSGTYAITATSTSGCESILNNVILPEGTVFSVSATTTTPSCDDKADGAIILTSANDIDAYKWTNGTNTGTQLNTLQSGTYAITATSKAGCEAVLNNIIIPKGATFSLTANAFPAKCFGELGLINLDANGATDIFYQWKNNTDDGSGNTLIIKDLKAGNYKVTVSLNGTGCLKEQTIQLLEPPQLNLSLNATNTSCKGNDGAILPLVTGGTLPYTFTWNDSIKTDKRSNLLAGIYTLLLKDANACFTTKSVEIKSISSSFSSIDSTICEGKSITIGTKKFDKEGIFTEVLKNTKNCDSTVTLTLKNYKIALDAGENQDICPDEKITLNAKTDCPTCNLLWSNGSTTAAIEFQVQKSQTLTLTATNAKGCQAKDEVLINVRNLGVFAANEDNFTLPNREATELNIKKNDQYAKEEDFAWTLLKNGTSGKATIDNGNNLLFSPDPQLLQYQLDTLQYRLCHKVCLSACDTAFVFIKYQPKECDLSVFNGITPEFNGQNDVFSPVEDLEQNGCQIEPATVNFRIINPWGDVIFHPQPYRPWYPSKSGEAGGAALPRGTYYYILTVKLNGKSQTIKGTVLVIDAP